MKPIALAIAVITLSACPPEGGGERQAEHYDIKDYWPLARGNFWHLVASYTGGFQHTYDVIDDYSSDDVPAYGVRAVTYNNEGDITSVITYYFVLRKDFLVRTTNKDVMRELIQDPGGPLPVGSVRVIAPRFFDRGPDLQEYLENEYTVAEPLVDVLPVMNCSQDLNPITPDEFSVAPDNHTVVTLGGFYCSPGVGEPATILGRDVFSRGVGPLHYRGKSLIYADIGGVEYTFEP